MDGRKAAAMAEEVCDFLDAGGKLAKKRETVR